jgi:type I restriction enzyme S subunit
MGTEWQQRRLSDLVEIRHGWPFKSECFSLDNLGRPIVVAIGNFQYTGGFRFDSTTLKEYTGSYPKEYELQPGDILLVMTCQTAGGEILGIPGRIPNDGRIYLHNQRMGLVRLKSTEADLGYLYWLFLSRGFNQHLVLSASGTKILHTAPSRIDSFQFLLPPPSEQKAIAHILGNLDDKIENNRRMNETLEEMARTIFKSWFIDFDPVRAKLEGRQPAGMDAETAALFPSEFEESQLGPIPKGWKVTKVNDLARVNTRTLSKNDTLETIEYIEISEVLRGNIGKIQTYNRGEEPSRARRRLKNGDTVISTVRPDRGSYFLCLKPPENLIASTGFAVVSPNRAPWSFIFAALTQPEVFEYFGKQADGGAYPAIRAEIVENYNLIWPDQENIAKVFHQNVSPLLEMAEHNRKEAQTLAETRDALLPKLLSGELRVPEVSEFTAISNVQRQLIKRRVSEALVE